MTNRQDRRGAVIDSPIFRWSLVLAWMCMVFAFSAQAHSGEITEQYLHSWNLVVRKAGHMTEYGILFCLTRFALSSHVERNQKYLSWYAFLISFAYAVSDEWHQTFVPGRSGQASDVLVDMGGVAIAATVHYLCVLKSFWSKT